MWKSAFSQLEAERESRAVAFVLYQAQSCSSGLFLAVGSTEGFFALDGKTGRGLNALDAEGANTTRRAPVPLAIFGVYRPPAVFFNGMSDGIAASRRAEHSTEKTVSWVEDD
jgi:hypothetical protein